MSVFSTPKSKHWFHWCILATLVFAAPASSPAQKKLDFNRDVRPILANHCLRCHGPDSSARKAKLRLDERASAYRVVKPGKPQQSELLTRVSSDDDDLRMPPPGSKLKKLSPKQVDIIRRWIKQGAVWAKHWSFQTPSRPRLPNVTRPSWPRNALDRFVLARLDREKLKPAASADAFTRIRRVTLTLTGVPPTPREVDTFLADESPDAYEKVVDRLLDSPRYGEHMSQAWLDAARYADSSGYQADWERFMWPWRDWVVKAFNANMPYDQFTIEQLAGDLLPGSTISQKLATGFNRNHRINDEGGSLDAEFEVEYVVDRVDTTATIWLGLTAGCARCHDHKYEPISQHEYYRLFAFFNNVPEKGIDGRKGAARPFIQIPNRVVQADLALQRAQLKQLRAQRAQATKRAKAKLKKRIAVLQKSIKKLQSRATTPVMVMKELEKRRPTYLLKRGAYDKPDKSRTLTSAIPRVFGQLPTAAPSDRLALARWLVNRQNPLTARVTVNRLWQHHFGTGLVRTSEDFGSRGERPSHPQLLDWLATELIRLNWNIKAIHRLIVTSAAFQQASHVTPHLLKRDPDNRLLARGPRRRLSGGAIRDQALFVSGLLSQTMGGPPLKPYQPAGLWKELSFATGKTTIDFYVQDHGEGLYRRSLYTFWKRTVAPPRMSVFDGTGREMCRVRTAVTNTPMQALTLQNDVTFVEAARHVARRMLTEGGKTSAERISFAWRLALVRKPNKDELSILTRSLNRYLSVYRKDRIAAVALLGNGESPRDKSLDIVQHAAYTMIAKTILNLDETITRE